MKLWLGEWDGISWTEFYYTDWNCKNWETLSSQGLTKAKECESSSWDSCNCCFLYSFLVSVPFCGIIGLFKALMSVLSHYAVFTIPGSFQFCHYVGSICTFSMLFLSCYRKSLCSKHDITVRHLSNDVMEDIIVREGAVGSVSITVSNTGIVHYQLAKIFVLCELNEIEKTMPALPLHLKSGKIQIRD